MTKSKVVSSSTKVSAKSDLDVTVKGGGDVDGQLCSGGMYLTAIFLNMLYNNF